MADITIHDLTNSNSSGVFDKLMSSMRSQLNEEFASQGLSSTDKAKVLSTMVDTVMSQSIQFLLQKDISAANAELIEAQTVLAETQELAVRQDIIFSEAQTQKVYRELDMMDAQEELLYQQIALASAQVDKTHVEIEVLELQKNKITADISLVNAQTAQAIKQVEVLTAQLLNIPKEGQVLDKQIIKTQAETDFLNQRIKTEKAQILDTVDAVAVAGVIGKQKDLYAAQTEGFARDAELKVAKALIDTWSVRRSTDDATVADTTNRLSDSHIGVAVAKMLEGVDITLP